MATYSEIADLVAKNSSKRAGSIKPCWIADAKERCGIFVKRAPNRISSVRKHPCPLWAFPLIVQALTEFNMLD